MPGLAASLVVAMSLCAQDPSTEPAPDLKDRAATLLRALDAPALSEREAAEAGLVALGPEALSLLPAADDASLSAEARKRLTRVRRQLELAATERMTQATTVTLGAAKLDLAEAMATIEAQTGNKLIDFRERFGQEALARQVELPLDKVNFWEAVDRLLDAAEMDLYPFSGEPGLALVERAPDAPDRQGRCHYNGAFRIEPLSIQATRDLRESAHWLDLRLEVAWEPRLTLVALKQPLANVVVNDDTGAELTFEDSEVELEASIDGAQSTTQFDLRLTPPDKAATRLTSVAGTIYGILATGEHEFRFDKLAGAKNVQEHHGDAVVALEGVRKNEAVWEVRIAVRFPEPTAALESHRGWIFNNRAVLVGPDNQVLEPATLENTRRTEQEVGIAYLFDLPDGPAGWTFVYRTATAIRSIPISYKLRDIELP